MPKLCPVCGETFADSSVFCPTDGTTLRLEQSSGDLVGSVIADRYQVSKLLGEGGMGRVYLARHVRLPQQAAIKVLHPAMVQDPDAVARFNREAANAARIEHDRVARVFDFGETGDGMVYLAMEFVPGRTLRAILDDETRLAPVRAANIAYQVSEGLDAAHRIGIVHRDLKPDNILVVTDDQGVDRCKVVDFGIAKAVDAGGTQLTRTGMIVGTPEFMSPEQVVGEAADARSDVYALALVTFQMMAGTLPFTGTTHERVLMSRLVGEPRTLREAAPDVAWSDGLQAVFGRALQRDVDARTPSALEFGEAVVAATEAWLGLPVLRGRTPLAMPAVAPTPTAASSIDAAALVRTAATVPAGTAQAQAHTPAPVPAQSASSTIAPPVPERALATGATVAPAAAGRRSRTGLLVAGLVVAVAVAAWAVSQQSSSAPPAASEVAAISADTGTGVAATAAGASPVEAPASRSGAEGAGERDRTDVGGSQGPGSTGRGAAPSAASEPSASPPVSAPTNLSTSRPIAPEVPSPGADEATTRPAALALAALRGVDSVVRVLTDERSGAREARAAVAELQRLLRDVPTATDSAGVYLALVSAYGQSGEPQRACTPLRSARRQATTAAQLKAVSDFFRSEVLACVP